ncbi:MAG TPA: HAMP domain-containing histidine kinase [Candidatus Obscuribacterales bacterium]|nr:HAMP domain-containing histidine kinase [Candidatus Obscuribacterales bacterium]
MRKYGVSVSEDLLKVLSETKAALSARTIERDSALKELKDKVAELNKTKSGLADTNTQLALASRSLESNQKDLSLTRELLTETNVALLHERQQVQEATDLLQTKDEENRISQLTIADGKAELQHRHVDLVERSAQLASSALELSRITAELVILNELSESKTVELEKRNLQLIETNSELNELLRQRDDFVASLTHDLKNPLIGVNRILEAILSGGVSPEDQQPLLQQIHSSNNFMLHMIWNLLDTYKHHSGALVPQLKQVNLVALLHAILGEFSFHMASKRQRAKLEIAASFPDIQADAILLRRALFNLIDNAIKFTPEDGYIEVFGEFDNETVRLSVRDSGRGIPFEQREKLFEQFWQGKRDVENQIGTGLGLYLTKNIVNLHRGTLECSSVDGEGATFSISLPRK